MERKLSAKPMASGRRTRNNDASMGGGFITSRILDEEGPCTLCFKMAWCPANIIGTVE